MQEKRGFVELDNTSPITDNVCVDVLSHMLLAVLRVQ